MTKFFNARKSASWILLSMCLVTTTVMASGDPLLIAAVREQDKAAVRELIARNVDVNVAQAGGATALHWAVHRDDLDTAALLIDAGANVNATNDLGIMPLSLACRNGNAPMVEILLRGGADSNATLTTGETVLMRAAHTGDLDSVTLLLKNGAAVDAKEPVWQQTALMWALGKRRTEIARRLVEHGADVHAPTQRGFTPLMFAARMGDLEASKLILDGGADINVESSEKLTALHVATVRGHGDVAALLLDRGANPNADGPGYTPLHWAAGLWETNMTGANGMKPPKGHEWDQLRGVQEGKYELVKTLLEHGADPDARFQELPDHYGNGHTDPPKGSTSLAVAAFSGDVEMIRLLAEHGADPSSKSETGLTPLMIATGVSRDNRISSVTLDTSLEAARAVVELGVDVNETNAEGNTALHEAAKLGADAIVQLLANNGADPYAKNNEGKTPLEVASRRKQTGAGPTAKNVPSTARKLLREFSVPKTLKKSMDEWSNLPRHIRDAVESLLQGELEKVDEQSKK